MKLDERCQPIELILTDVDGVLTDGRITYTNQGIEQKSFYVRDGLGIRLWQRAGFRLGILTARSSHIVKVRAAELQIELLRQGIDDKLPTAQDIVNQLDLQPEQLCYIGDDLTDLPVIRYAGLGVAVADAAAEVQQAADHTTQAVGGRGAVRELVETILKAKRRWDHLIEKYSQR